MEKDKGLWRMLWSFWGSVLTFWFAFGAAARYTRDVYSPVYDSDPTVALVASIAFVFFLACISTLIYSVIYWLRSDDREKEARFESWEAEMRKRRETARKEPAEARDS